jgi:two-component system phosphate regulon sensor histidine kinase PhoR
MLRVGLLIAALGTLLLLGVGALLAHSLRGIAKERRLRHQLVAERLFDELERELTDLIVQEEGRSFLEYRYFYVPEAQLPGLAGLARSPLSRLPRDPAVLGWFQREPDGALYTPFRPRPSELQLAADNYAQPADPMVAAVEAELLALLREVDWGEQGPAVTEQALRARNQQAKAQRAQEQESLLESVYDTLNRGTFQRQKRADLSSMTQRQAVEPFQVNEGDIPSVLSANLLEQQAAQSSAAPAEQLLDEVGVRVSPMEGLLLDPQHLLLHRGVTIDGATWRQGLVLRLPALEARLDEAVLGPSELAPHVNLAWGGHGGSWRGYAFTHVFAPPFGDLDVVARMGRIPGHSPSGAVAVVVLSGLLLLLCALGGLVLYRTVSARVELAQRRSDFVAAVSHELKTPLTSIRMMAELLRGGMVPAEARKQQYYETITAESERLSRLIGNVLELSRLERGVEGGTSVVGSVEGVLEAVLEVLGPHARQRGFTLELDIAPDLPPASMDRDALLQVLVNLVDNAIKFAASAEDKRVVLRAYALEGAVVLAVRDHGPGVPPAQLRRVFQPFYRGERELTRRTKGTGIGLALVQGLVQRMGGQVEACNHPRGGLEVRVLLQGA